MEIGVVQEPTTDLGGYDLIPIAFEVAKGLDVVAKTQSLKTRIKAEAVQKINAMNETERQPGISLGLARVYLNATDPKLATRTWQDVMENIITKKTDETLVRWQTAIKDKNFDCIRKLRVAETRPEHFDRALADGKLSTNVYLRRIHNHALGMESEVWIAEDPDHMIHFNGERFLGPYPDVMPD